MRPNASNLSDLLVKWQKWSKTADQSEDGWQSCFPDWELLITAAVILMKHQNLTNEELRILETCWQISEEDEDLADYAKANLTESWTTIIRLFDSPLPEVRWQVYEVLAEAGSRAEDFLKKGIQDKDSYCRRRAILSLARLAPHDAKELATPFINDPDLYIRQAAMELMQSNS